MADGAQLQSDSWWLAWPGLLAAELDAFAARGAQVTIAHQSMGVLVLDVVWPRGDERIRLRVGYSPLHPFFRPAVVAPDLRFPRHQHPIDQGLCLITQGSGEWRSRQRVADFLYEQLDKVFAANAARQDGRLEAAAALEEQAPDPVSTYYDYFAQEDCAIFFDGDQLLPKGTVGFAHFEVAVRPIAMHAIEGVLRRVEPVAGRWLAKPFTMPLAGRPGQNAPGRWVRMAPPATTDVDAILAAAEAAIENATALQPGVRAKMRAIGEAEHSITGIVFEEELAYGPGRSGNGWLFITSATDKKTRRRENTLVRGFRVTGDLQVRVPVAAALAGKHVLLIGAGAIGGFAAVELARAGVTRLTILEPDVVEPGNSVRWPLGRTAWGVRKGLALKDFIERNYPGVVVAVGPFRVGAATTAAAEAAEAVNPLGVLRDAIREADVVVDASASTECQEAVAHSCRVLRKPFAMGYSTEGAAGGVVARFPAGCEACYVCLQAHWADPEFPRPTVDAGGTVTPIGCNQPTFTGAAFDLQEVSMELVRSAVGMLAPEAYDPGDWQVAILTLTKEGKRRLPQWTAASLAPRCEGCGSA